MPRRRPYLLALLVPASLLLAQAPGANYDETKVGAYRLPDPLVFNDGSPVRSAHEWKRKRRQEIFKLFEDDVYGRAPRPLRLRTTVTESAKPALDGLAERTQVTIAFSRAAGAPEEHLMLYFPAHASGPTPLILTLNFAGNQAVIDDPGVPLPQIWNPKTHRRETAAASSRGRDKQFAIRQMLRRGYGFGTIYYGDIEPDFKGGIDHGIRLLFLKHGETEPAANGWGAIGAWSYGLSRAMDYLATNRRVDAKRVAIMGHSRLGKAILWAGASDERFAMILASCPGEGGASLARRNYGEALHNLAGAFPYWFCRNFAKFASDPATLPVDMHELIALNAPRPLYITGAEEDRWSDPKGEFLAEVAAGPVYRLLGRQDLGTDRMPALNKPVMHTLAFHYRTGKHDVTAFDWEQFLTFADRHLKNAKGKDD